MTGGLLEWMRVSKGGGQAMVSELQAQRRVWLKALNVSFPVPSFCPRASDFGWWVHPKEPAALFLAVDALN
jgi:hypothetical protein